MRAAVRGFHSPDVDLATFDPEDPADLGFLLQILVGPRDGIGEESFDLVVCSPAWLERELRSAEMVVGLHHLIVSSWNYPRARAFLTRRIEREVAPSWSELTQRLARLGHWELQD